MSADDRMPADSPTKRARKAIAAELPGWKIERISEWSYRDWPVQVTAVLTFARSLGTPPEIPYYEGDGIDAGLRDWEMVSWQAADLGQQGWELSIKIVEREAAAA